MKPNIIWSLCFLIVLSCSNDDDVANTDIKQITDARDGQTYRLVTLGSQTWFAQNLNYQLGNGESKCYNDTDNNCFTYGKLYRGDDAKTACPEGFHLPDQSEWLELFEFLGGETTAYAFLSPYADQQGIPINFDLLAGGYFFGSYQDITEVGRYWTSSDGGYPNSSYFLEFEPNLSSDFVGASHGILMSCRCLKD